MANNPVETIKAVRAILGCGLREARDFYDNHGIQNAVAEAEKIRASGQVYDSPLDKIRASIKRYYAALDAREHGGVAQNKAFEEIQAILGMSWMDHQEQLKRQAAQQ